MGVLKEVISYINSRPRPNLLPGRGYPGHRAAAQTNASRPEPARARGLPGHNQGQLSRSNRRSRRSASENLIWEVTRDPKERPTGRILRECGRARVWRLIRAKKFFTKHDLVISSGAAAASVDDYVRILAEHGYIRATGKDGRRTVYMLTARNQVDYPPLNRKPKEVAHGS
jgi:hypothetical protein